ncbi:ComZ family protein [Alteribacillus persepolensis]|nr:ComZ family protein [Alteribacillus persepolensis]
MKFMQVAMQHLPEAKTLLDKKGIELDMEDMQPAIELLTKVMEEAYNIGYEDAKNE